jgi:enhancing lycopene biosynthesis protein 2
MSRKQIAVILCGCGHRDGSEIHEATLTLWAIHANGADYQCFAPNILQHHVLNHLTGEEMPEQRHVLIESARIARGQIADLATFDPAQVDALVLPGGFGAAKNLCSYAFDGPNCTVHPEVERAVRGIHQAGKPLGALCIAPVILAKILGQGLLTLGEDSSEAASHLRQMGAEHQPTRLGEIAVDPIHKLVTSPCYMLESRLDHIAAGADQVIQALIRLM